MDFKKCFSFMSMNLIVVVILLMTSVTAHMKVKPKLKGKPTVRPKTTLSTIKTPTSTSSGTSLGTSPSTLITTPPTSGRSTSTPSTKSIDTTIPAVKRISTTKISTSIKEASSTLPQTTKSITTSKTDEVKSSEFPSTASTQKVTTLHLSTAAGGRSTIPSTTKPPATTKEPELPVGSSAGCPSPDWVGLGKSCYLLEVEKTLTFSEAEGYCVKQRAHLASVHNSDDNYKLSKLMWKKVHTKNVHPAAYWIGLKLEWLKNLVVPMWTDNSTVDYSDFLMAPNSERCTEIQYMGNEWREANCSRKNHFTCVTSKEMRSRKPTSVVAKSTSTNEKCICAGCIACYVFIAVLGLVILLLTRKCFWSWLRTGRFGGGKSDYAYKSVMKELSSNVDDETDDDF